MNLCTNARDAMSDHGGQMRVSLQALDLDPAAAAAHAGLRPGRHLLLEVADTGPGIPADILGKVFEPYFTTKSEGRGTGLGLAVVHGIVRSSGGAVTIESEGGAGTAVRIFLPVTTAVAEEPAAAAATEAVGPLRGS